MAGLPRELMESSRIDGASDFEIFMKIVLPLSFPVLASFAIFQFLWVWNDLLVAMVFLGSGAEQLVLTGKLNALLGSRGGDWEILTTSAFITIIVPLIVFFAATLLCAACWLARSRRLSLWRARSAGKPGADPGAGQGLVARGGDLPDLPAQLPGSEWRRNR
jgi:ABC-type spermidine/putrescine transport system permease subunit II